MDTNKKLKYPYYREDPNVPNISTVIDVRGNIEYRINCKSFNGLWYVKNVDLIIVDNVWVLKDQLVFDNELGKEVQKNNSLIQGIVRFDGSTPVIGYYSSNPYRNCVVRTDEHGSISCINYEIVPQKYYFEELMTGIFRSNRGFSSSDINILKTKKALVNFQRNQYNIEDDKAAFNDAIKKHSEYNMAIDRDLHLAGRYIKGLSFGAELETSNGMLPNYLLNQLGIIICKDGSIKDGEGHYPPEYVTVPYRGSKGLQSLRNASIEIARRSNINIKCSYHLHIGGIAIDRVFMVSLFKLALKIQDDVFKMFPYYKTDPSGIKEKNYCKKLPDMLNSYKDGDFNSFINDTYSDIFTFLSGGIKLNGEYNRNSKRNPWGEGKWNIKTRYYWLNFINLIFSSRNTIEFRIHTPTLNGNKIINWIFMCAAIVRFAEKYPKRCISNENISFIDVLNYYKEINSSSYSLKLSTNLVSYYEERCKLFDADLRKGDFTSTHDITSDNMYSFNVLDIC